MIKKLSLREVWLFVVTFIMILFFIGFQWFRQSGFVSDDQDQNIVLQQKKLKQYYDRLNELKSMKQVEKQWFNTFGMKDSEEQVLSNLVAVVQNKAQDAKVQLINLRPAPVQKDDFIVLFPLQLSFEGAWESVMPWIDALQQSPHFISIGQLRLEKNPGGDEVKGRMRIEYLRIREK